MEVNGTARGGKGEGRGGARALFRKSVADDEKIVVCDVCGSGRARWYCAADEARLCSACDASVHSANAVAQRHDRVDMCLAPPFPRRARTRNRTRGRTTATATAAGKDCCFSDKFHGRVPASEVVAVPDADADAETAGAVFAVADDDDDDDEEELLPQVPALTESSSAVAVAVKHEEDEEDYDVVKGGDGRCELGHYSYYSCSDLNAIMFTVDDMDVDVDVDSFIANADAEAEHEHAQENEFYEQCKSEGRASCLDMKKRVQVKKEAEAEAECACSNCESIVQLDLNLGLNYTQQEPKQEQEQQQEQQHKIRLHLNYDDVLNAWSGKGTLWASHHDGSSSANQCVYHIPSMTDAAMAAGAGAEMGISMIGLGHGSGQSRHGREARVLRYREKRRSRLFSKKIRYQVRKLNAEKRPRMKGRFVKRTISTNAQSQSQAQVLPL